MSLPVYVNTPYDGHVISATSKTQAVTISSGKNRLLLVFVSCLDTNNTTSVTYRGESLISGGYQESQGFRTEIWYMLSPHVGTSNVVVTMNTSTDFSVAINAYTNVHHIGTPIWNNGTTTSGTSGSPDVTHTSVTGDGNILFANHLCGSNLAANDLYLNTGTAIYDTDLSTDGAGPPRLSGATQTGTGSFDIDVGVENSGGSTTNWLLSCVPIYAGSQGVITPQQFQAWTDTGGPLSFTCGGDDTILIVYTKSGTGHITAVNYNGDPLTLLGNAAGCDMWYLVSPDAGTHDITLTSTSSNHQVVAACYSNVDQTTPFYTSSPSAQVTAGSGGITTTVPSELGHKIVSGAFCSGSGFSLSISGGQTRKVFANPGSLNSIIAFYDKDGGYPSGFHSWAFTSASVIEAIGASLVSAPQLPLSTPNIISFTPILGPIGVSVVITGEHFTNTLGVSFNGTSAPGYTVNSDTQITVNVPTGATTGPISITNLDGTGDSDTDFTVVSSPTAPTGLTASITDYDPDLEVTVSWDDLGSGDSATLERSTNGTTWSQVTGRIRTTDLSYVDTDISNNTTYYYRISSYGSSYGSEGSPSTPVSVVVLSSPTAPNLTDLTEGGVGFEGQMMLVFNYTGTPDEIKIFRKRSDESDYTELTGLGTSTTSPRYDNTIVDGYIYSYKLIASNDYGDSPYSGSLSLPSKVIITESDLITETPHLRRIIWDAVVGSANYSIYRSIEGDYDYDLIKTTTSLSYDDQPLDEDGLYMGATAFDYYVVANVMRSSLTNGIKSFILDVTSSPASPPAPYLIRPDIGDVDVKMTPGSSLVPGADHYNLWWRDVSIIPTPSWTTVATDITSPATLIDLGFVAESHRFEFKWVAEDINNPGILVHGIVRNFSNNLLVDGSLPKPIIDVEKIDRDSITFDTPIWVPESELWDQTNDDDRVPLNVTGMRLQISYSGSEWRYADLYEDIADFQKTDVMPLLSDTDHRKNYIITGYPDLFDPLIREDWVKGRYYYARWIYMTGTPGVDEEATASYFSLFQIEPAPPIKTFIRIDNDTEAVFLVPEKLSGINSLSLAVCEDGTDNWFTQASGYNIWNKKDGDGNLIYEPGVSEFKFTGLKKNKLYNYRWVIQWQFGTYYSDGSHNIDDLNISHGSFTTEGVEAPDAPNEFSFDDTWAKSMKIKAPSQFTPTTGQSVPTNIKLWYKKDGDSTYKLAAQNITPNQIIFVRGQDLANNIPRNALIPDNLYWFYMEAINAGGSNSTALVGERTDLIDPVITPTFTFTIKNITAETLNVIWPALTDVGIVKIRLYYKNIDTDSAWISHPNEYYGQNVIIDNLEADTRYKIKLAKVFPADIEEESYELDLTTLVHTPTVPIIKSRTIDNLIFNTQSFYADWKRLDLEKKDGSEWNVVETQPSAGEISINSLLPAEFRRNALGDYGESEGDTLFISNDSMSPKKIGPVSLSNQDVSSMVATVPSLPGDCDYINIYYTNDLSSDTWTQLGGDENGGENLPITGLLSNEFYYFKAEGHNDYGKVTSDITYTSTLKIGETATTETGDVPMVSYVLLNNGTIKVTAPSISSWPANTQYIILESREITENDEPPETNLWRVAKTNIHINDEFIIDREYATRGITSEFRWVAKNDGV
jgi:hypothetical protein